MTVSTTAKVVIAVRDSETRETVARGLDAEGCETRLANSTIEMLQAVVETHPAVLVFDLALEGLAPDVIIAMTHKLSPQTRIVVRPTESGMKDADVIEKGVFFYAAGIDADQLTDAVRAGIRQWEKT